MRLRLLSLLLLLPGLCMAQGNNAVFPAQVFYASGQTGQTINLNGSVGAGFNTANVTVTGVSLTTVTFQVMGSGDAGTSFYPLQLTALSTPGASPVTTVTATANGIYQFSLSGITHIKFVTSGTFTASSVRLVFTASPQGSGAGTGANNFTGAQTAPSLNTVINPASVAFSSSDLGQQIILAATSCSNSCTLDIPSGSYAVNTSATAPAGIRLLFEQGAVVTVASGVTWIVNSTLETGRYQIFAGTGTVSLATNKTLKDVYPEWWGADPTGVHDSTAAIQAAFATLPTSGGSVVISSGTFRVTSGVIDMSSTTAGVEVPYRTIHGMGMSSEISCQPSSAQAACLRNVNGSRSSIKDLYILCDSNVTYCLDNTVFSGGSEETVHIDHVWADGGQYAVAIGPDTAGDVSDVEMYNVFGESAVVSGFLFGNGEVGDVLDNYCWGCKAQLSPSGVTIAGGGAAFYGGEIDHNSVTDWNILTPADQPLTISGIRSEESGSFMKYSSSGVALMPITVTGQHWTSQTLETDNCVITDSASSPLEIRNSAFTTDTGVSSSITFCITPTGGVNFPLPLTLSNVGTNNPNFPAVLASLATTPGISLDSSNDYLRNQTNFEIAPGSGLKYWTGGYYGNPFGITGSIGGSALAAGACSSGTVALTGLTTSMHVGVTPATYPGDGFWWEAYASAAGTATVKVCASVAGTPAASIYNARVIR